MGYRIDCRRNHDQWTFEILCKAQSYTRIRVFSLDKEYTFSYYILVLFSICDINIQKGTPRLDKSVTFHQYYRSNIENNVTVLLPIIAYPKPQNISWIGGSLTAPWYTIEGTITPKKCLLYIDTWSKGTFGW